MNLVEVLSCLVVCWISVLEVSYGIDRCFDPPNLESRKLDLYRQEPHESFLNLPYTSGLKTKEEIDPAFINTTEGTVHSYSSCHESRRRRHRALLEWQKNTSCPWYYVEEDDLNRYPRKILEARCACPSHCHQVINRIRVLRRTGCDNNFNRYEIVSEPVAVGCTSVLHCRHHISTSMGPSNPGGLTPQL